jgi:predicted dehydrogenase
MSEHILIVGSGSVGKRHARNLAGLGCRVSCVDPREDRRRELANETAVVGTYFSIAEAFERCEGLTGVVIASPTAFHPYDLAAAIKARYPVLLEKPMARTLAEAREMLLMAEEGGGQVLLGYTWRWWPPLVRVRELLNQRVIGKVHHVQFHMSAHLADWHPWERYQDFFMSSVSLGGGALLDESHWIDLMLWLFGMPEQVSGRVEKISDLEIETDDNVDALAIYSHGLRVTLHLDLYGRPHEKSIRFTGDNGTLHWSAEPNRITIGSAASQVWGAEDFVCDRNEMFVAVAREYLDVVAGIASPTCTLTEGVRVMEMIEAIRSSSREGRIVTLRSQL